MDKQIIKAHPFITALAILMGLILVFLFFFLENVLIFMGGTVLEKEEPVEVDYIVVLQGGIPDRIIHGVWLYEEGYGDDILMVESHSFTNYELIEEYDLDLPSDVEINKEAALQLGVSEEDINVLPGRVDSTRQEAEVIGKYFTGEKKTIKELSESENFESEKEELREVESILLVTSRFHSKRASMIFEDVFKRNENELGDVEVISTPSPHDPFSPESWWLDRRQARNLFMEYMKFINYYTFNI